MNILHLNNQARFQGGVEQLLFDTATSLESRGISQGLLFSQGGSDLRYRSTFSWSGMDIAEAETDFRPDVIVIHKFDDTRILQNITQTYPTLFYVHDHDLVCPRRHKYLPVTGEICNRPAGLNCIGSLCVVERAPKGSLLPVRLLQGMRRQRDLIASTRQCTSFAVGSRWMQDSLVKNGIPGHRIKLVPPVPIGAVPIVRKDRGRDQLLFVGQIVRGKGVDLLLRAMALVDARCELVIAGEGNHRADCELLTSELGIRDRVTFTGFLPHEKLDSLYADATLVAVPSRWPEPFGMVGIEAMSRGKPVVAFSSGGITDWLAHNETGLLAEPGNVVEFAHHIDRLLLEKETYDRMSTNAVARVRKHYTHEKFIDNFLAALPHYREAGAQAS